MSRIIHFEINASEPQTLIYFYTEVLGWKFNNWGGSDYWLIETGPDEEPGINGGLLPRTGAAPDAAHPVNAFVCTASVDSLDDTLAKAISLGAVEAMPKGPVMGIGWVAYIKDPDGNLLGLLQPDENAR